VTHPINKGRFGRISASAVKASDKYAIITYSRSRAFQPAKDESRTLPLTTQRVAQKR